MYNYLLKTLYTATTRHRNIFFLALAVRVLLILLTPGKNQSIDLCIYMDGGQLVSKGVNPYKHQEATALRHALRTDSVAHFDFVDETQERWDNYASSNLPLSLLLYGAIDSVSSANGLLYRLVFMFFDALLAVLIAQIILRYWRLEHQWQYIVLIGGLGICNPILLHWGAVVPEEKGLQILLMLGAWYFAREKKWALSAVLLGMSVAFKGLGIFIAPLCLYEVTSLQKTALKRGALYILLSAGACLIWFLPYMPEVFGMMQTRLSDNIANIPEHSSIWVPVYQLTPRYWETVRYAVMALFVLLHLWAIYKKKISLLLICCSVLLFFVDITLNAGSIDRMNIGFLSVIMIIGTCYPWHGIRMGLAYIILGGLTRLLGKPFPGVAELMDSLFCIVLLLYYTGMLITLLKQSSQTTIHLDETEYSHSRA